MKTCLKPFAVLLLSLGCSSPPKGSAPPLAFHIDPAVAPQTSTLPDGRPVGAVQAEGGHPSVFITNEVLIAPADKAELDAFLARTHGVVVRDNAVPPAPEGIRMRTTDTAATEFAVKLDASTFGTAGFVSDAAKAGIGGKVSISSGEAAGLLALTTHELANGHKVTPNFVFEASYINSSKEAPDGKGGNLDIFKTSAFWATGSKSDVVDVWRAVAAKPPPRRGRVAIVDSGFWLDSTGRPMSVGTGSDLPAKPAQWDFVGNDAIADGPNGGKCTGGAVCNWHGNGAAGAAAGIFDNQYGAAGTGGQVVDPMLFKIAYDNGSYGSAIRTAVAWGADVVSMSFGAECDNSFCDLAFEVVGIYPAMRNAWSNNVVLVAAAGNGTNDGTGNFVGINTHQVPCRGDHIICVGALDDDKTTGIGYSNFGPFVDIWAPTNVPVMPDGDKMYVHSFGGTSASTPFVAGIIGILRAYDPTLNADDLATLFYQTGGHDSADPHVTAYLNAYEAFRRVAGNVPPEITVQSPLPNAIVDIHALGGVEFRAQTNDMEEGMGCCTVHWSSLKDGPMGDGADIRFQFPDLGVRLITAQVEDSKGGTNFVDFAIDVVESPPSVVIDQPLANGHLFDDTGVALAGHDVGLGLCQTNPQSGQWTSNDPNDVIPAKGCAVSATFHGVGARLLTFTVTGPFGAQGSASVVVTVDPKPAVVASIIAPTNGSAFNLSNGDQILLEAYTTGATPLVKSWTWQADGQGCAPFTIPAACPVTNIVCTMLPPAGVTDLAFWDLASAPPPCGGTGTIRLDVSDALNQQATPGQVSINLLRNPN